MARRVCMKLPDSPAPLKTTIPGAGEIRPFRRFALEGYDACSEAHAQMMSLQPIFIGMSMPLCILGCVTSITKVFITDPPFIDATKLLDVPPACACLATFTPLAFASMIKGLIQSVLSLLGCFLGLLADLVALQARAIGLLTSPKESLRDAGQCLMDNVDQLSAGLSDAFGPVSIFFDAIGFLFTFIGISPVSLGTMAVGSLSTMISDLQAVVVTVQAVLDVLP